MHSSRLHDICENHCLPLQTTGSMSYIFPKVATAKTRCRKAPPPDPSVPLEAKITPHQDPNQKIFKEYPFQFT